MQSFLSGCLFVPFYIIIIAVLYSDVVLQASLETRYTFLDRYAYSIIHPHMLYFSLISGVYHRANRENRGVRKSFYPKVPGLKRLAAIPRSDGVTNIYADIGQ